ncbi:uncharacterized protein [Watersipora subatra]|uniref:uncharacterized protein n=1 Tax=Watersipora subatra TaxID=2589382 RepID=UPI00355C3A26
MKLSVTLILVMTIVSTECHQKDLSFLVEQLLDEVLEDGYCQGMNMAKLTAEQCKQNKWKNLVKLLNSLMTHCLARTTNYLDDWVRNNTYPSSEGVQVLVQSLVMHCLDSQEIGTSTKYSKEASDPCTSANTKNLTEWWRQDNQGSNIRPNNNDYHCDKELQGNEIWFRIKGAAGTHIADKCVPQLSCGSHGGFWSDAKMPTKVGDTWEVPVHGSLNRNCDWYTWPVKKALTVKRCSAKPYDFVYKLHGTKECEWAICGTA